MIPRGPGGEEFDRFHNRNAEQLLMLGEDGHNDPLSMMAKWARKARYDQEVQVRA